MDEKGILEGILLTSLDLNHAPTRLKAHGNVDDQQGHQ